MESNNMKKLKRDISKLNEEYIVQKYKEVHSEFFATKSDIFKKVDDSEETKRKLEELSHLWELLRQEIIKRKDLKLEKAINKADEEFLEEAELEFNGLLETMIEELGDRGILDAEQCKSVYKKLLEFENKRIIQRYVDIEEGVTIEEVPEPEGFRITIDIKKNEEKF